MAIKKDYGSGVKLLNYEEEEPFNEEGFQKAYKKYAIEQGLSLDPDDPRHFYNYRGYYKKYKEFKVDEFGHLSSEFKEKGHSREFIGGVSTITGEKVTTSRQNVILGIMKQGVIDPDTILDYLNYDQQGKKVGDFTSEEIKELQPKTTKVSDDIISKAEELTGLKLKDRDISYSLIEMDKQIKGTPLGQQNKNVIVINSSDINTPAGETSESSLIHELMHTIVSQNALDKDMSYEEREAIVKDSEYYYLAGGKGVAPKFTAYEPEKPVSEPLISEKGEQTFDYGSGVKLLKPIPFGLGAKAVGGATLPEPPPGAGVSQRMRGIGEPPKKYKLESPLAKLPATSKKVVQMLGGLQGFKATEPETYKQIDDISKEINKQPDELSRIAKAHELLTGEPIEESLKEMGKPTLQQWRKSGFTYKLGVGEVEHIKLPKKFDQAQGLAQQATQFSTSGKIGDVIRTVAQDVVLGYLVHTGLKGLYQSGMRIEDKWVSGEKLQAAMKRAQKAYITETGKFKATLSNSDLAIVKAVQRIARTTGVKAGDIAGVKVPQQVFMGQAGSVPNLVKVIQNAGKMTPEALTQLKTLTAIEVSQVTQQLLNISPALASEFLKAVEKPEAIPNKISIGQMDESIKKTLETPVSDEVIAKQQEKLELKKVVTKLPPKEEEPIPEGGEPPPTVSKQNTIFNSIAKKVEEINSKIIKTFDIEAPFNKIGAQETGFQVKNYFNNIGVAHEQGLNEIRKLNKLNVKPVTTKEPELKASGQLDYTDITYLSERPGYFVKLTPEERKIASSAKKAVKDFYKGWEKKLTEIGWMEEPFPKSFITRANNRIYGLRKQLKDVKKPEEKTVITNEIKVLQDKIERIKKQKIQFVSVPVKTIFSNAEDNPEVYNKIMSILPKWDRETITVKDLVEVGVLTRKEADIRYIIGEYSDRMGKKYALGKIFETAAKEGLIKPQALAPNWPSARVYVNGRYVDIPQLRGKRLEPFFSDTVTDFFSKGQVMASPIFGTIKMMQFYNPLMMPMYDVWQSAAIGTFLNPVKGAMHIFNGIKDTVKKTDNYWAAYENGIFSKPFSIPYDKFKIQFERAMKGNKLSTFLKEATLPTNWLRMLYSASWHTAWKLDETIRMISFNYLKDKGLTDRRAAQLAALFHSDYASVPPATRRTLNKILFTPTFKITMSKLYLAMLKGGAKTGAKGFKADESSKILGRGALLALATMFGIKLFFESQGYEEEEVFRKYVKSIETDEGIKENVITLSHPFNIPWRYYYRVKNAWKPQNLNKIEALVDAAKWDLHPIWRVAYDIAKNSNYRIYNPFDKAGNIAFDLALYTFGEFVAISKGILESAETGEIKAENFRLLQKDMGRLRAIIIKPFIFNYARTPESRKVRSYIEKLRKEFDYLMRVDPSKDPKVNYQRVENFKNRISEIRKIIDKEVPPKGDIKIKYGSGVEILEKDYGAGVKLLK